MNGLLSVISFLVILNWGYCLFRMVAILRRFPPPEALKPELQEDLPFVSILVPARNEAGNIKRCVDSLLKLDYPRYEIIVVNDRSTDDTLAILRHLEEGTSLLRVVTVEKCEEGWTGKNYALHVGVEHARGTWLLFSDADTVHEPLGVRLGIQETREHKTGFLSFYSQMDCRGFWEALIQPMASGLVSLWFPIENVNDPSNSVGFANGQYLLMDRHTYGEIGGHAAVKDCLLEDVALVEEAKRRGIAFRLSIGTHVLKTRMYRGFRRSWKGWKRIFVHLHHRSAPSLMRSVLGLVWLGVVPLLVVVIALVFGAPARVCLLAASAFLFTVVVGWVFSILSHQPQWPAPLFPLSAVVILGILLNAVWDSLLGRKTCWRGAHY